MHGDLIDLVNSDCLPVGFTLCDPSNMSESAVHQLLEHLIERQDTVQPNRVFRFEYIPGKQKNQYLDAPYSKQTRAKRNRQDSNIGAQDHVSPQHTVTTSTDMNNSGSRMGPSEQFREIYQMFQDDQTQRDDSNAQGEFDIHSPYDDTSDHTSRHTPDAFLPPQG